MNFTPYVTGTASAQKPYEPYYMDPVYDMRDLDEDGSLDNPGDILYHVPTRTGQKDNYSIGIGFSATWSKPLDKELQQQCKDAAAANIALMNQMHANKRLDFEIARLKNCGELLQSGIRFAPGTPYASICADVQVVAPPSQVQPHVHSISSEVPSATSDVHKQTQPLIFFPSFSFTFFNTFLIVGLITFSKRSATGFAKIAVEVATTAIVAVVVTISTGGRYFSVNVGCIHRGSLANSSL